MAILHLYNIFGAPTEKAIWENTLKLSERGWQITVAAETVDPAAPKISPPVMRIPRIEVKPTDHVAEQMNRIAAIPPAVEGRFDLVHGHFGPRILHGASYLMGGVPMVVSLYGYDVGRLLRDRCWIERYKWATDHGAILVALAESMLHRLIELEIPKDRLRLIRLGIDLPAHAYRPSPAEAEARFVFIGRLVEKKGADILVRAMAELPASVKLDLIGAGPMEANLRGLVDQLKLAKRVRFVGHVPFEKLFDYLNGATALVQPSVVAADGDAEGAPMVLMHAQAVGVPCITTRHSGNPEVLPPEGQRFVTPQRDPSALAAAMGEMIQLSAAHRLKLQRAGREWIEQRFDLSGTVTEYDLLYRELMGTRQA